MSRIEWTDETWNPAVGCSRCSPGCDACYAIRVAAREMQPAHVGLTARTHPSEKGFGHFDPDWTGEVRLLPERLEQPLHWRKPRRVFVGSMTDLFHPDVPNDFIVDVFGTMGRARRHTFQLLTKRPQRMAALLTDPKFGTELLGRFDDHSPEEDDAGGSWLDIDAGRDLPNVWLGTSVENQRYADLRIPHLLATPAAVRFLSIEPLLGPVTLDPDWLPKGVSYPTDYGTGVEYDIDREGCIDWVIVGGESGPGARPMHPAWVRDLRDQCVAAGVPFFFKQWGAWGPVRPVGFSGLPNTDRARRLTHLLPDGSVYDGQSAEQWIAGTSLFRWPGAKGAGRELDGRTWDEMPERVA